MEYLNKVQLRGRVGNARVNRFNNAGVCRFSLATEYQHTDRQGCQTIDITWHNCSVWERSDLPPIDQIEKGSIVELEGRIRVNKYTTQEGIDRTCSEIVVQKLKILSE